MAQPTVGMENEKFAPVEVSSVLEVAYRQLRDSIMSGHFPPGEHVRQEDVARRLGISRGPAREALNRLVAEGMVKLLPRRGYVVEALDPAEVEDIFEMRAMLEERAGYLATKKRQLVDVASVEELLGQMESVDFDDHDAVPRWAELNRAFHSRLFESCGRAHLCRTMMVLRDRVERYVRFEMSILARRSRTKLSSDPRKLFQACKAGHAR